MRNTSSARFGWTFLSGVLVAGIAPGWVAIASAQAQPSTLAYDYQAGSFSAQAEINPLAGRLLGRILQKEIPSAVTFSATELAGSFTIPDATATIGNGSITFDSGPVKAFLEPYLQQAMGRVAQSYSLPEDLGIETLEAVLNYRFVGQGLLKSANNSTAFTFEYGDGVDRLSIQGVDPDVLALCQVQECNTEVDGDFDLKLDVEGLGETSEELGIRLPSSVKRALRRAKLFGLTEVAFADGKLTSVVQVLPNLAPPVTEDALGLPAAAIAVPDIALPEVPVPEVPVPEIPVSEIPVPEIPVPETPVPEVTTPEISVPEMTMPEVPGAAASAPGGASSEASDSEASNAEVPVTEAEQPEANAPEANISQEADSPEVNAPEAQPGESSAPVSDETSRPLLLRPKVGHLQQQAIAPAAQLRHQLTHGNFVFSAERMTAPWSVVFSAPAR